ncbi:hypothetical protein [Neobacillus terrae]|uniref:hypothetical protein n=1 Tax=Neobacillus terrae TaxID=3034837 RepID=UPI001409E073|nr:hypothetical protein [Neobacillus terrae]NHM29906.1 hypothetical protein [Neobacillus terrae]
MKKFYSVFLLVAVIFLCAACQNADKAARAKDKTKHSAAPAKEEKKIYKLNEEGFMSNAKGEKIYSVTINSVKEVKIPAEDMEYVPKDSKQTVVVDYTYKYLKKEPKIKSLLVYQSDLTVYDKNQMAGTHIDLLASEYPFDSEPTEILPGRAAETHGAYSLKTVSDTVQIDFISPSFHKTLTFEAPIQK